MSTLFDFQIPKNFHQPTHTPLILTDSVSNENALPAKGAQGRGKSWNLLAVLMAAAFFLSLYAEQYDTMPAIQFCKPRHS